MDRRLLIALVAIGAILVIGIIVVIVVLLTRGTGAPSLAGATTSPSTTNSASATPTQTPTPAPAHSTQATSAPVDNSTHFTSFNVVTTVHCAATEAGNAPKPVVTLSWASQNAVEAWFSPANVDAKDQGYMQVPTSGNQNNLTDEHLFDCSHRPTEDVTITLVGPSGEHVSKHATITDADWKG